jgi:hypothetical protein
VDLEVDTDVSKEHTAFVFPSATLVFNYSPHSTTTQRTNIITFTSVITSILKHEKLLV